MRQRVAIATAFLNKPDLVIADEPTTALDVTIQGQILAEAQALCARTGTAMIWITHDLAVVSSLADRIAVMYAGRIVETGKTSEVVSHPLHPYTMGLMGSVPSQNKRGERLIQIPGMAPSLLNRPPAAPSARAADTPRRPASPSPSITEPMPRRAVRCFNPLLGGSAPHDGAHHRRQRALQALRAHARSRRPHRRQARRRRARGNGARRRQCRHLRRQGRGRGPRRRVGLRQVHARPHDRRPAGAHRRQGAVQGPRPRRADRRRRQGDPPRRADDLPGPLRLAQSARPRREHHRRGPALPRPRRQRAKPATTSTR